MAGFPAWFYGPNGEAEIFEREEEIPAGWADAPARDPLDHDSTEPSRKMHEVSAERRKALRTEYERVIGKKPFMGWSAEVLRQKLAQARN